MRQTVAVLGAGNMGTALAQVIASNGHAVRAWSIETDVLEELRDARRNTRYLAGVDLHPGIEATWELEKAVDGAALILVSVPSQVVRTIARDLASLINHEQVVLNVAKGLESETHLRMSEVLAQELGEHFEHNIGSMGGPAIAIEMARGEPMAAIAGVEDEHAAREVQRLMQNEHLKVQTTPDVCGLELCSTLKNIYAILLGICDGMGYGTNTKAFLATLAVHEMSDIVNWLGGRPETVHGLAGVGDLLTTGFSKHSRNRSFGELLGSDGDWHDFLHTKTVEGAMSARAFRALLRSRGHQAYLLETVNEIIFEDRPCGDAIREFLREFSY